MQYKLHETFSFFHVRLACSAGVFFRCANVFCRYFLFYPAMQAKVRLVTPSFDDARIIMFFILDIEECATGTDNCNLNANCTNTKGSFYCTCHTGYSGDGVTCVGT